MTSKGCDSIVYLDLTVTDTISENISQTICQGEAYTVGNQTFNQSGYYTIFLIATDGCDSLVNLSLTVLDTVRQNVSSTICDGDSLIIGNQTFKDEGNYSILITSAAGCDSVVNLSLSVIETVRTNVNSEICEGQTVTIGDQTFSETGEYTITLLSSKGCDSIVILNLTVQPNPVIDAVSDKTSALPDEQIQLNVITTEILSYNWSPSSILNSPDIQNPTASINAPTWFKVIAVNRCNSMCFY